VNLVVEHFYEPSSKDCFEDRGTGKFMNFLLIAARIIGRFPSSFVDAFRKAYGWTPKAVGAYRKRDSEIIELTRRGEKPISMVNHDANSEGLDSINIEHDYKIVFLPENRDIAEAFKWFDENSEPHTDEWNYIRGILFGYPEETMMGRDTARDSLADLIGGTQSSKVLTDDEKALLKDMDEVIEHAISEALSKGVRSGVKINKTMRDALEKAGFSIKKYNELYSKLHGNGKF